LAGSPSGGAIFWSGASWPCPPILGNLADPLIYMLGLGYGLGAMLPTHGRPALRGAFLAAGTVCASTMNAATFEALYSAFSRMHVQKTWDAILNTPLGLADVVAGELFWAATKSLFSGAAILVVITALGLTHGPLVLWALPAIVLTGLAFAALGLIWNALAPSYDFFMYYFTLFITPMTLISGVFFPTEQLPGWLAAIGAGFAAGAGRGAGSPFARRAGAGKCADPHHGAARDRRRSLSPSPAPDAPPPAQVESMMETLLDSDQLPRRRNRQRHCAGRGRGQTGRLRQYSAARAVDLSLAGRGRIGTEIPLFIKSTASQLPGAGSR
jgi:lipooligosaccharide transport system permease protein